MEFINFNRLEVETENLRSQWNDPSKPFRYLIFENILHIEAAELILNEYPDVTKGNWDNTTYINQKNKFTMTSFESDILNQVFNELNGKKFITKIEEITGVKDVLGDEQLFGGGLHQSINGAFLDVHVDFNIHEITGNHRRMNAIIFMNKDWKREYNGFLELWDMKKNKQLENISPEFNNCVIFETNEISFHGHPKPLKTPNNVSRKSLAVYYYTKERPEVEVASGHNTIYVNTEGIKGNLKNLKSGVKALFERIKK